MKKLFTFLFLMGVTSICKADLFDYTKQKEYSIWISSVSPTGFSGTTSYILIDLSDTTNWPHKDKGEIHITSIYSDIDKAAASTSSVRMGVINMVSPSTGSITWFNGIRSGNNVSNTDILFQYDQTDYGLNLKINKNATQGINGTTPYLLSTEKTNGSSAINLSTGMPTIQSGYALPGVGDVIIEFAKAGTAITYNLLIKYYTQP